MTFPAQRDGYPPDLMTVAEVASLLRVSTMTVYRLMRAGEITSVRIGRSFRLRRADVAEYLHGSQLGGPKNFHLHFHRRFRLTALLALETSIQLAWPPRPPVRPRMRQMTCSCGSRMTPTFGPRND